MKCVSFIAAVVLLVVCVNAADAKPLDKGSRKVMLRLIDGGVVRMSLVREGDANVLEVKIRLRNAPPNGICLVHVWPAGVQVEGLEDLMTDERGRGETTGRVYLPAGLSGLVPVGAMIMCFDEAGMLRTTYYTEGAIYIAP